LTPPSGTAIDTSTIVPPPNGITATPHRSADRLSHTGSRAGHDLPSYCPLSA
jgi:hypothetical protein